MSWRRLTFAGSSKVSRRSKRPGRSRAGSSWSARLVDAMSRTFAGLPDGPRSCRCGGSSRLTASTSLPRAFCRPGGLLEGLHLHEQLVDGRPQVAARREGRGGGARLRRRTRRRHHRQPLEAAAAHREAGRGSRRHGRRHPGARRGRCASNSSMKPTAPPCLRAAFRRVPEVAAHLARRGSLETGLERRGGGEQERHAGLGGQRLRGVGLAGAGTALEEQAATRPATHLAGEAAVRQEQLQRLDDLVLDDVDAHDVGEPGVDLLRPDHLVRRPTGEEELPAQDEDQRGEEEHRHRDERVEVRQPEQVEGLTHTDPVPEVRHDRAAPEDEPQQPGPAQLLAGPADVSAVGGRLQVHEPPGRRDPLSTLSRVGPRLRPVRHVPLPLLVTTPSRQREQDWRHPDGASAPGAGVPITWSGGRASVLSLALARGAGTPRSPGSPGCDVAVTRSAPSPAPPVTLGEPARTSASAGPGEQVGLAAVGVTLRAGRAPDQPVVLESPHLVAQVVGQARRTARPP